MSEKIPGLHIEPTIPVLPGGTPTNRQIIPTYPVDHANSSAQTTSPKATSSQQGGGGGSAGKSYSLPQQHPNTNNPSQKAPIPHSNDHEKVEEGLINGEAIDKLIRQARHIKRLYYNLHSSPEWPEILNMLRDWEALLQGVNTPEGLYWLKQIHTIIFPHKPVH